MESVDNELLSEEAQMLQAIAMSLGENLGPESTAEVPHARLDIVSCLCLCVFLFNH